MTTTTTTNYGWTIPQDSELVKDGAAAIRTLGNAADASLKTVSDAALKATIVDAKGDLIAATAADTVARVAVGTDGQVLTADAASSAGVKWATASSGGMTLLGSMSLTSATNTFSSISGDYKNLQLVIRNIEPSLNDGNSPFARLNGDSNTRYGREEWASVANGSFGYSSIPLSYDMFQNTDNALIIVDIPDYANTTTWKRVEVKSLANNSTNTNYNWRTLNAFYNQNSAISSISINFAAGTANGGNAYLYGVK